MSEIESKEDIDLELGLNTVLEKPNTLYINHPYSPKNIKDNIHHKYKPRNIKEEHKDVNDYEEKKHSHIHHKYKPKYLNVDEEKIPSLVHNKYSPKNIKEHKHINVDEEKIPSRNNNKIDNDWNFGCCKLNKNCVQYFSQLGIIIICIGTSIYQITNHANDDKRDFWVALLSSSVGYIMPNPKMNK